MRYEYVEPFVNTTMRVLDKVIQCDITKGAVSLVKNDTITEDVAIIVRLQGNADGSIILSMPVATALGVCSAMFGETYKILSPAGMDAIAELANMIAGNTTSVLNDMGFDFTLSPPLVVTRNHMMGRAFGVEAFHIPLFTEYGEMTINVAMRTN